MKKFMCLFLIFIITLIASGRALAVCSCKQPAYKDQIDFLSRYTQCLEQCFTYQIEQVNRQMDECSQRIRALESEINRLQQQVKILETELTAVKEIK